VDDSSSTEELISRHQNLVRSVALKLVVNAPENTDVEELVAYGQQGLVQAATRYDPSKGATFATFAYYRIRGAIIDGLREMGPLVRQKRGLKFQANADEYIETRSKEPPPRNATDAAERLDSIVGNLAVAYVVAQEKLEGHADMVTPDPELATERREELSLVRSRVSRLPTKERSLIELMYFEDFALVEAAKKLDMSKGWASRLHARALDMLRKEDRAPPTEPDTTPARGAIKV